jgi:hypothetical protein
MKPIRNNTVFKGIALLIAALSIKQLGKIGRKGKLKLSDHTFPQPVQPLK